MAQKIIKRTDIVEPLDVIEVATFSSLPVTGVSERIYITQDDNIPYRWDGADYVSLVGSITTPSLQDVVDIDPNLTNGFYITQFSGGVITFKDGFGSWNTTYGIMTYDYIIDGFAYAGNVLRFPKTTCILAPANLQKVVTANYSIVWGDNNYTIFFNSASPITVTINSISGIDINNGIYENFSCDFYNLGAGAVTFVNGTATVGYPDGTVLNTDKVCALIKFMATTTYKLKGELV